MSESHVPLRSLTILIRSIHNLQHDEKSYHWCHSLIFVYLTAWLVICKGGLAGYLVGYSIIYKVYVVGWFII